MAVAIASLGLSRALAQDGAADGEANPIEGRDPTQGVYVRDSAVALEKFALAQRMERLKEWDKSADVYQEILEKYPDRVVPSQTDQDNKIYQYTSVMTAVHERLAKWPDEGLAVYRGRYETAAAGMLEAARPGDFAALHKVCSLYFVTDAAKTAGVRLVNLYFEAGEFPAAAWLGDRLLTWHPGLVVERPQLLYQTALAYHLSGQADAAKAKFDELSTQHARATGTIRGQDIALADALQQALAVAPPVASDGVGDSWPMLGGSPDRARVPVAEGRPNAKIVSIPLVEGPRRNLNPQQVRELEERLRRAREHGLTLGVMPVVDRDEMFFQDGARVYAVSVESGVPLPEWRNTYGGAANGQYSINATALPRNTQLTVTLTDNSVLAIMGQADRVSLQFEGQQQEPDTRLVCLDRRSGKERWTFSPRRLPDSAANLRGISLTGSPLVVGDSVYVVARGGKGVQFEDCYLLSLDANTGAFRWACYVASANTGNIMWGDNEFVSDSFSHIAYASGRLYVLTNLGALAAVDAYSGAILWLNIYPRDVITNPEQGFVHLRRGLVDRSGSQSTERPWSFNYPLVTQGKVFILPTDGKYILVYDAGTGVEVKRIDTSDLGGCDTLLGVVGPMMVVCGESSLSGRSASTVMCINWQNYELGKFSTRDRNVMFWPKELSSPIRGRGFVTTDSVFVPTAERLFRIGLASGKVEETYPKYGSSWDEGEGPGNVLVTGTHVIIAGARRVDIYTDMLVARAKLDAEVAAAADDPEPRLRYAEVMFVAGEMDLAMQKVDEAVALLGGIDSMRAGAARDRLFNDALTFAQKLADEDRPEAIGRANELFDRAAAAAGSASQRVNYRVSRARFAHRVRDFNLEAKLFQEILSDPEMRIVTLASEDAAGPVQAGLLAEKAIMSLIRSVGPACYEPFEQAARTALDAAAARNDPDQFLAVAQTYPNARVAPQALMLAANAYEAANNPRLAAQVLRQVYFKYPDSADKPEVIESMVRNYLAMPNRVDVAIARLAQGAKLPGNHRLSKPLTLPDKQTLTDATFAEALDALRKYQGQVATRSLPDFHLPPPLTVEEQRQRRKRPQPFLPPQGPGSVIAGVTTLVAPLRDFARHDRVVTWSTQTNTLSIRAVGAPEPLVTVANITEPPAGCAWLGGSLVVWSTATLWSIDENGSVAWKSELRAMPAIEVVEAGGAAGQRHDGLIQPGDGADQLVIRENEVIIVNPRQRVVRNGRFPLAAVQLRQQAAPPNVDDGGVEQIVHVRPMGDRIIFGTSTGRLGCIEAADGTVAWQTRLTNRPIDRLLANDDFTVVRIADDMTVQLVVLDTFSGQFINRWSFGIDSGAFPLNMALSADGMLVFTLPDRICGKDLYEPGSELNYQEPQGGGNPLYIGATQPDQLLISEGRILALSDNGQFVRLHSLETGRLIRHPAAEAGKPDVEALLKTETNNWGIVMRIVGPHLYVIGQRTLVAYNLDRPEHSWRKPTDTTRAENFREAFVGQDYLVLLDESTDAGGAANGRQRLLACSRAKLKDRDNQESGLWVHSFDVPADSPVTAWQPVEGGFYYLTNDAKLHFLQGSRVD